jgi:hypothetical protein
MKLNKDELTICINAMNQSDTGVRQFSFDRLGLASSVSKDLMVFVEGDEVKDGEHDVELTTEQKMLIRKCVSDRSWPVSVSENVLAIVKRLNEE